MGLELLSFHDFYCKCMLNFVKCFSAPNEMNMWFFEFVYIVDYTDGFLYTEWHLHPWDEGYLIRMDDCFDVFLDSVYKNFIERFCIDIPKGGKMV